MSKIMKSQEPRAAPRRCRRRPVVHWIDALPREVVLADATLSLARASLDLFFARLDEGESWLHRGEQASLPAPSGDGVTSIEANVAFLESALASQRGDVTGTIAAAKRSLSLEPTGELARAIASLNLGHALYYRGELAAASAALDEALRSLADGRASTGRVFALSMLALVHVDGGGLEAAEHLAGEAERLVDELAIGESAQTSLSLLARGKLSERRGDSGQAAAAYARAAVLARSGGRRLDLAHALLLLARFERRRDHVAARTLAREAREILATCPDPGVLAELLSTTERALQLTAPRRAATGLPVTPELSERELAVLRLLASNLSQREIGAQLYVSFNTVKAHTRSIFRKLGVSTRAEAVARSRELGSL